MVRRTLAVVAVMGMVAGAGSAHGQTLPSEPLVLGNGRMTIGGDLSATFGSSDPGFFDYSDYDHSTFRMMRVDVIAALNAGDHFAVLGEIRTENLDTIRPYALYLRIRPWSKRAVDIQVGRVPPTFGAFARRSYASDNPLVGYPLAYQYLTSLRPDALPANADELLRKRGLGWLDRFSIGSPAADRGVPLVSASQWDTGVQVHAASGMFRLTGSVTAGTVSNPLFNDDNGGRQLAARVELRPAAGWVLGTSIAQGPFVSDAAARAAVADGHDGDFTQTAWGADVEYSRQYYLLRVEAIVSGWRLPIVRSPELQLPLTATSISTEGRYKIKPGFYVAGRVDHLAFGDLAGSQSTEPWDAPVTRLEAGAGYSIQRNLLLKLSYQYNRRDGGPLERISHMVGSQLVFWF